MSRFFITPQIFAAGLAAGLFFSVAIYSPVVSELLLVYLPAFPLLLLGLSYGPKGVFGACVIAWAAAAITGVGIVSGDTLSFVAFTLFPVFYFMHRAMRSREENGTRKWYPVLSVLAELSVISAVYFLLFSIGNGPQTLFTHEFTGTLVNSNDDPQFQEVMKWATGSGSYLLFAWLGWSWILLFYATSVLANRMLGDRGALRPSLAIEPARLPVWLLGMLCINAAVAVLGQGNDSFTAKTVTLLLFLPYFLAGLTLIHKFSLRWKYRQAWLTFFYILLILQVWPLVLVAFIGLFAQIAEILDKRRGIG